MTHELRRFDLDANRVLTLAWHLQVLPVVVQPRMPDERNLVRTDDSPVLGGQGRLDVEVWEESAGGGVGDRHLQVAVLRFGFDPVELPLVAGVVHPLGFLDGDTDDVVADLHLLARVGHLVRHVLQGTLVRVALLAGKFELAFVDLLARLHGWVTGHRKSSSCERRQAG